MIDFFKSVFILILGFIVLYWGWMIIDSLGRDQYWPLIMLIIMLVLIQTYVLIEYIMNKPREMDELIKKLTKKS